MSDQKYNGWTNYATWRINLEIFDGIHSEFSGYEADQLKDYVEELLEQECDNSLTNSYAMAFINDVNWHEIAEHCNEDQGGEHE